MRMVEEAWVGRDNGLRLFEGECPHLSFLSALDVDESLQVGELTSRVADYGAFVRASLAPPNAGVRSAPAEVARIRWHLARVEVQLRARDVSALTPAERAARTRSLDVLHEYWVRGVFPVNTDFPGRHVPYFIDRYGTRCAMAYL